MLLWISLTLFLAFLVAGAVDGLYFHLRRFRLWERDESWFEHVLHTVRAVLVPAMLALFFVAGGPRLTPALVLVGLDVVATVLDVAVEPRARKGLGGLPRAELAIHVVATVFHVAALAFAFASLGSEPSAVPPLADLLHAIAWPLVVVSAAGAIHHIALAVVGAPCLKNARTA